ncbi:MAG: RimK/LysX family protein [Deltaproteobacteria bacterium]
MVVGWREWISLPELHIPAIKAKVDTGARTSALHAFKIKTYREKGKFRVRFGIHPLQKRTDLEIICHADIIDRRMVTDSGGHRELRWVICTPIRIQRLEWPVEMTLTNRDKMNFRMLLGRMALHEQLVVNPAHSFLMGPSLEHLYDLKKLKKA